MIELLAQLVKLIASLLGIANAPARKEERIERKVEAELKSIANEVEAEDDDRTEQELRDILGK